MYQIVLISIKYSVHYYFYQQDHDYYSTLNPKAVQRHFVVVVIVFCFLFLV